MREGELKDSYKSGADYPLYYERSSGNRRKDPDNGNPGCRQDCKAAAEAIRDYAAGLEAASIEEFAAGITEVSNYLISTRPTAVSLPNAVKLSSRYSSDNVENARKEVINNANLFIERADKALGRIGKIGAGSSGRGRNNDSLQFPCRLSIITTAFEDGKIFRLSPLKAAPGARAC